MAVPAGQVAEQVFEAVGRAARGRRDVLRVQGLQEGAGGRGQPGQGRAGHEPAAFGVLAAAV